MDRIFVEKKSIGDSGRKKALSDIKNTLGLNATDLRIFLRYDVDGLNKEQFELASSTVFSEPPVDNIYSELPNLDGYHVFATEYLPGQYDQRADSACQCVQLLTMGERPLIKCATVYAVSGCDEDSEKIEKFFINPVEARLASMELPLTLVADYPPAPPVEMVEGFIDMSEEALKEYHKNMGFAMSMDDLIFVCAHFRSERRNPTVTELKVIDTYWSDHCRHTTFLTRLDNVKIKSDIPHIKVSYEDYINLFNFHYQGRVDKHPCLMDIATMGARELKRLGRLSDLDASDEINACSIKVTALIDGKPQDWLVMFKNETHNHPTEIEPFGGAATCLGGAIRDPLSGRVYVYQAMRITGAGDVNLPYDKTMAGKLPQRVISKTAAHGFSSYGNQIGLATGIVNEVYHPGFVAKRLETGFVVGAAPEANVIRSEPKPGDVVILIGGETGRDGCGGATGSSKAHTIESIDKCGAEVQKGNPLTERKIQRLFRNSAVTSLIKRCNDFGAGGISVAIGELSDGLDINLDKVTKKYMGLDATELAISESQERMAVVVSEYDSDKMIELCRHENLTATVVAKVTDLKRMRMFYNDKMIVDLSRKFLDSNGALAVANATIKEKAPKYFKTLPKDVASLIAKGKYSDAVKLVLSSYNVCSQKGLSEMFDSTIGAGSVFMPLGGKFQLTPSINMSAKLPVMQGNTDTATVSSWAYYPLLMSESPFIGAIYSVLLSVIKVCLSGVSMDKVRLTLQEFFCRLGTDSERWGQPLSALLGALNAQLNLGLAAIGGKDSMSGTFEKIDVPPTLISFALGYGDSNDFITNVLSSDDQKVLIAPLRRDRTGMPDYEYNINLIRLVQGEIMRKNVEFATVVEEGGAVASVIKSCLGNGLGFAFEGDSNKLFLNSLGDIIFTTSDLQNFEGYDIRTLGTTKGDGNFYIAGNVLTHREVVKAYTNKMETVYPTTYANTDNEKMTKADYVGGITLKCTKKIAKPKIFIPVFPGTNCEYDTARSFRNAGGEPVIFVIKNRNSQEIAESVKEMVKLIDKSQIIAFPGGFSGGDEPDGSGKFIATTFMSEELRESVLNLLYKRDGLALGICNGFQALIKLGLLPYGKIEKLSESSPTLTFNKLPRHVSTISRIRVASNLSPWLAGVSVGESFGVAISHGEGRLVASEADLLNFAKNGQIATQYVDLTDSVTMQSPFNPNGSMMAIEGITSVDGRILGKMGHSERIGSNLMKNVPFEFDMRIFESGVKYFK